MDDADSSTRPSWIEIASAIVLSAAALLTAFAGYQADLWDGEQAAHYAQTNTLRTDASRAAVRAGQGQGADLMTFGAWLSARADADSELDHFYRQRFRPQFRGVFEQWLALRPMQNADAPPTPFAMPGYVLPEQARAEELERQAVTSFEAGQKANDISDSFVLATVILASALFFGGINQIPRGLHARKILLAVAVVFLALGSLHLMTLPLAP